MKEFIDSLIIHDDVGIGMLVFMIPFLLFAALFKTIVLRKLYGWKYNPKWLFFALEPAVLFLLWSIKPGFTTLVILFSFILTFALALIGFIIAPLAGRLKEAKTAHRKAGKRFTLFTAGKVTALYISGIIAVLVGLAIMQASIPLIFLIMFIFLPLSLLKNPGGDRRFMRLQATLPTSPIRSVAMGLAEVEGVAVMVESLQSPIDNTECIAYRYEIEKVDHDREGRISYTTIYSEKKCNAFSIQDETGILDVTPEKLNLLLLPVNKQYQKGGKRYTQRLLLPGEKVLLVGMADTRGGKTVFRHEDVKSVYALMPSRSLNKFNKAKPLINSLVVYTSLFGIIASLILLCHIEYSGGRLRIRLPFGNKNISDNHHGHIRPCYQEKTFIYKQQ